MVTHQRVHTHAQDTLASRELFANDEGVCIPAPLLLQRLKTLTQINRQHGPAITISASPLLPASRLNAPPSHICLDPQLRSIALVSSPHLHALHLASSPLLSLPFFSTARMLFPQLPLVVHHLVACLSLETLLLPPFPLFLYFLLYAFSLSLIYHISFSPTFSHLSFDHRTFALSKFHPFTPHKPLLPLFLYFFEPYRLKCFLLALQLSVICASWVASLLVFSSICRWNKVFPNLALR